MIIRFYCMRHGEKDGDEMTIKGFQQVAATALHYLRDIRFVEAYSSGMNRATQTVEHVLKILNQPQPVTIEEGFGYAWITDDLLVPHTPFDEAAQAIWGTEPSTVYDWLRHWPEAMAMRGRFTGALLETARGAKHQLFVEGNPIAVLVGSHSPCLELAVLKPRETPSLIGLADMVVYDVAWRGGKEVELAASEYLPAPSMIAG